MAKTQIRDEFCFTFLSINSFVLLKSMLAKDPRERLSPEQLIESPFFKSIDSTNPKNYTAMHNQYFETAEEQKQKSPPIQNVFNNLLKYNIAKTN